jgi:hypothetical protein
MAKINLKQRKMKAKISAWYRKRNQWRRNEMKYRKQENETMKAKEIKKMKI